MHILYLNTFKFELVLSVVSSKIGKNSSFIFSEEPLNHVDIAITFHGNMITIVFAVGVADFFHRESVSDVVG
jgi:hypothetical protein